MIKVGIIGVGYVGSAVAFNLISHEEVDELYLYDINEKFLLAQSLDLEQSTILLKREIKVKMAKLKDLFDCDIIINTASAKIESPDRMTELKGNAKIVNEIFSNFIGYKGIIINVSNPCDIITKLIYDTTKIDSNRIIGTGTILDSMRLKSTIMNHYNIPKHDIDAWVFGEHGEDQFFVFSNTYVKGMKFLDYLKANNLEYDEVEFRKEVMSAGANIFNNKWRTEYGIASVVTFLVRQIVLDTKVMMPICAPSLYNGQIIYTSKLSYIGKNGYLGDSDMVLDPDEQAKYDAIIDKMYRLIYSN